MDTFGVLVVFLTIVLLCGLFNYQMMWTWPVVRPRLEATWPRNPGIIEGFSEGDGFALESSLKAWLPAPELLTKKAGTDCPAVLNNAAPSRTGLKGPYKSYDLLDDMLQGLPEPRVAGGPTAANCYKVDYAPELELGSYAQRTNNYLHKYPDSCNAPYRELILDFYKPEPAKFFPQSQG